MSSRKKFGSKDIGAELLPIITSGLYRDPLDTLREYIQNSIDAKARNVEVKISSDLLSVRDDGHGMSREIAEKAIRLGISEKRSLTDVGFRGIGIYSAFNICDTLEIYTRSECGTASKVVFDFKEIRNQLEENDDLRNSGDNSILSLEDLLTDSVWVDNCTDCPIAATGTLVMMVGLRGHIYKRLNSRSDVKNYLKSVVPLPFHPDFCYKDELTGKFTKEDYRVINLDIEFDGQKETLYRPYHNGSFTHDRGFKPKYFTLRNLFGHGKLGFAWVCLNDARKYLEDKDLRGLQIKKFGFSVGSRDNFAPFFSRSVFNNRITGEIIIQHKDLIPNAARSEFEAGDIRDSLYMAFSELTTDISTWANNIQQELKAREELETIAPSAFELVEKIPKAERDIEKLLGYNILITSYQNRLKSHTTKLRKLDNELLEKTLKALTQAKDTITEILGDHKNKQKSMGRKQRTKEAHRTSTQAPNKDQLTYAQDQSKSILDVAMALDIDGSPALKLLLEYIDRELLRKLSNKEQLEFIQNLQDYLEDNI